MSFKVCSNIWRQLGARGRHDVAIVCLHAWLEIKVAQTGFITAKLRARHEANERPLSSVYDSSQLLKNAQTKSNKYRITYVFVILRPYRHLHAVPHC
jgi:hypothetical protein